MFEDLFDHEEVLKLKLKINNYDFELMKGDVKYGRGAGTKMGMGKYGLIYKIFSRINP